MGEAVTIYSREDALAMAPADRPLCHRIPSDVYHGVFEAVGMASMCWNPRPASETFDTTLADKTAVDLCFLIANAFEKHGVILLQPSPIPLTEQQESAVKQWAADDRLWTTQETVAFNLRTFARSILKPDVLLHPNQP